MCDIYNGYKNRQTWCLSLWINNEEQLQQEAMQCNNAEEIRILMEDMIEAQYPGAIWGSNFVADLLGYDFAVCDWQSIYDGLHEE